MSASDAQPSDFFGWSVSISGTTAAVGAIFEGAGFSSVGAVYMYDLQGGLWAQSAKLQASDGGNSHRFGASISLKGDRLLVGAVGANGFAVGSGAVYVFERQAGMWLETAKLSSADGAPSDHFGVAVDQSGDRVLVGQQAADAGDFAGSAYVYDLQGAVWVESAKLVPSTPQFFDLFGDSVALTGDTAFVGASQFDSDAGSFSGAVYAFKRVGSTWHETLNLVPADLQANDVFGKSLAADGNTVLIGAIGGETTALNSGTVYGFGVANFATLYCLCPVEGPCGNNDPDAGCANSTGSGALLTACGSPSVSRDDLVLNATGLPANVQGIIYSGANMVSLPFGDGLRCVGQAIQRFAVSDSGSDGAFSQSNLASLGLSVAGQTRHFQTWYRNPAGPCSSGFNLSNGLSLAFTP